VLQGEGVDRQVRAVRVVVVDGVDVRGVVIAQRDALDGVAAEGRVADAHARLLVREVVPHGDLHVPGVDGDAGADLPAEVQHVQALAEQGDLGLL
jgi:hypothetical protein